MNNDVKAILAKLEEENKKLRAEMKTINAQRAELSKTPHMLEKSYKGIPVAEFHGNHRPFYLGAGKLKTIVSLLPEVKAFIEKRKKEIDKSEDE
jgi:prefoldin subunit 5